MINGFWLEAPLIYVGAFLFHLFLPLADTPVLMPLDTYRSLQLESLYELLTSSIRDMLVALDTKQDNLIAYKAIRKQVELLLQVIDEKRKSAAHANKN